MDFGGIYTGYLSLRELTGSISGIWIFLTVGKSLTLDSLIVGCLHGDQITKREGFRIDWVYSFLLRILLPLAPRNKQ